ncbi:hypothetical protein L9F63_016859, partial [Diploptera punctata]
VCPKISCLVAGNLRSDVVFQIIYDTTLLLPSSPLLLALMSSCFPSMLTSVSLSSSF